MIFITIVAGCVLLVGVAFYFYWIYAPLPNEPVLASKISREKLFIGAHERPIGVMFQPA